MNLNSTASWIGHRKKTGGCDVGDLKRRFERIFYILYIYIYIYDRVGRYITVSCKC